MTEKENYLRVLRGEMPEWVPHYSFMHSPYRTVPTIKTGCPVVLEHLTGREEKKDIWGVTYVGNASSGFKKVPHGPYILDDITKWRDVIKAPDLSGTDWERVVKKDLERFKIDRNETAVTLRMHVGYFQLLISFMGFEEGLIALIEEPEECRALVDYLNDFYIDVYRRCIDYYKPDVLCITDDQAAWSNPFFSLATYREIFKPAQIKQSELAHERNIPIEMHCCGRCEDFIDDWMEFGVNVWQTAQPSNDLHAIKKKYKGKLAICGGWHPTGELLDADCPEEKIRAYARELIDEYAPGGGFVFYGTFLGAYGDESAARKNRWIADEVEKYGKAFYK